MKITNLDLCSSELGKILVKRTHFELGKILVQQIHFEEPKIIWEIDTYTLKYLRKCKNKHGEYLWKINLKNPKGKNTLLDIPIYVIVTSCRCLQLKYTFKDGRKHIIDFFK